MKFEDAIAAHAAWKVKLRTHIKGDRTSHDYDIDVVSVDNKCEFGQWIYGEGKSFGHLEEFHQLKAKHKELHLETGRILKEVGFGSKDFSAIEPGSKYYKLSVEPVTLIRQIRKHAESEQAA